MYEIGDEVIYQGADKSAYRRRGVVMSIEDKDGKPQLTVAFADGEEFTAPIDDWSRAFTNSRRCNSTNPTVANAMNARTAKNADVGSALLDAIAALSKLANVAKAEGNKKVHERAVKAGTILYGMKPAW